MTATINRRVCAEVEGVEGPFVVFLIGARLNR